MSGKVVFLKQSGERLTKPGEFGWSAEETMASAENIGAAQHMRVHFGVDGLVVVSGAGNVVRGEKLRDEGIAGGYPDVLGRLAIIQNTIVLADALRARGTPNQVMITSNMEFSDPTYGRMMPHSNEATKYAHSRGKVVLIAGGTGEDAKTTDNAVAEYAARYKKAYSGEDVVILKGTQFDGIYADDPRKGNNPDRYAVIGAPEMLADYARFRAVDQPSLETLVRNRMNMRIYQDGRYSLSDVIQVEPNSVMGVGTLITWHEVEKVVAT